MAMVLRWFICDMAIATDAGGSPMGSRGWGIIMKGRSNPEREKSGDDQLLNAHLHPLHYAVFRCWCVGLTIV